MSLAHAGTKAFTVVLTAKENIVHVSINPFTISETAVTPLAGLWSKTGLLATCDCSETAKCV